MTGEIRERLDSGGCAILADYRGLSVEKIGELRNRLRTDGFRLQVVKNSFLRLALRELDWAEDEALFSGPTAMISGTGDITAAAKSLKGFAKEHDLPSMKGGWLGGKALTSGDVDAMATIPPREVLLGTVVGTIAAPMSQLVGVLSQKLMSLLYALKAVEDKKRAQS